MESHKTTVAVSILLTWAAAATWVVVVVSAEVDCVTVTALMSTCSSFIARGSPDPIPGSPCCEGMNSLDVIADTTENKQCVCRCLMSLIFAYNPNATAIATLPGFCGVSLGFIIDPNTDCTSFHETGIKDMRLVQKMI